MRDFVFECLSASKKPATIRRYVSTIGRAHRASGVLDPTASEEVKLALKEMGRKSPARQKQVRGLTNLLRAPVRGSLLHRYHAIVARPR